MMYIALRSAYRRNIRRSVAFPSVQLPFDLGNQVVHFAMNRSAIHTSHREVCDHRLSVIA